MADVWKARIDELKEKRKLILEAGGSERIYKQHKKGKLLARERLETLFDDGIFFEIDDYDEWYSLTNLIAISKNKEGKETFEKFSEATGRTYLFNYDGEIEITFRVVVGDIEENSQGSGQILVGSEPISKQFTLKIK